MLGQPRDALHGAAPQVNGNFTGLLPSVLDSSRKGDSFPRPARRPTDGKRVRPEDWKLQRNTVPPSLCLLRRQLGRARIANAASVATVCRYPFRGKITLTGQDYTR